MANNTLASTRLSPVKSRFVRLMVWGVLLAVMAVGFVGYLSPGMRMNWESIAAMCGF